MTGTTLTAQTCTLNFEVSETISSLDAPKDIIKKGETLKGHISFTVRDNWQQGAETNSFFTDGLMQLTADDGGQLTGKVKTVHITRTTHTWDYISIIATRVKGHLAGQKLFFDPMVFTLADKPNTLTSFTLPSGQNDWSVLKRTKKIQFHVGDHNNIVIGKASALVGSCN
jgi:hypothetical protein